MTGLQRRLAEREAKERLRRDIHAPSDRKPGQPYDSRDILEDAINEFDEELRQKEKIFKRQLMLDAQA